jgi:hypothetical protein
VTARHRAIDRRRPHRSRRFAGALASGGLSLLLLVAALLVGPLPALAQDDAGAPAPARTLLRLAQLQSKLPGVELTVTSVADPGTRVAATLQYGDVLAYRAVEPGDYVVTMRPAGSDEPPKVSKPLSVQPGTAYTVAAVRHTVTPDDLGVFTDDLAPPQPGRARLRVVNAAMLPGTGATTEPAPALDAQPVASGLPTGQASPYRDVAPGAVDLSVGPPGSPGTVLSVTVAPNQVASVVLTSGAGGPRAKLVVDAGGPAAVPPGPVHAGFGGASGTGAPVRSAVLAVLAAVAAGVSVRLARSAA